MKIRRFTNARADLEKQVYFYFIPRRSIIFRKIWVWGFWVFDFMEGPK